MKEKDLNMSQVIAQVLNESMKSDSRIVVLGEDVGKMGGVFGSTRSLQRDFSPKRVIDTPISEQSFVGMAVGMAQAGLRPIVEVMFVDFIGTCLDQVYNQMAKNHYMSGGSVRVPMVIKTAVGCIGDGAQHSQVLSGLFAHLPGMKLAFPSCPGDARGLMKAALATDDPVVFFEHKKLLMTKASELNYSGDLNSESISFGKAAIVRSGKDITVVSSGWMIQEVLGAAFTLAEDGIDIEVVDLRTIVPWDKEAVITSALKTGVLLVVDEDYLSFGVAAEIIATVAEHSIGKHIVFGRHAVPDVPIPASEVLERAVIPDASSIAECVKKLLN